MTSPSHRPTFLPFRTPVRGHAFAPRPPRAVPLTTARPVELRREPDNPADPLAVAVWVVSPTPWRIGYLERAVAARLAPRLDRGEVELHATIEGWVEEPGGRWQRPVVAVAPARRAVASHGRALAAEARAVWDRPPGSVTRPVGPR